MIQPLLLPLPDPGDAIECYLAEFEGASRENLRWLYSKWEEFNEQIFAGLLRTPVISLLPAERRWEDGLLGTCGPHPLLRHRQHITICTALMPTEDIPYLLPEEIVRWQHEAEDTLLHEMVHQFVTEVIRIRDLAYMGHGPRFAAVCSRVGRRIGLHEPRSDPFLSRPPHQYQTWPGPWRSPDYYFHQEDGYPDISLEEIDARRAAMGIAETREPR